MRLHVAMMVSGASCLLLVAGPAAAAVGEAPYVVDSDVDALLRVDPVSGIRTVVSGCRDVECQTKRGSGPGFAFPRGIIFETSGDILVCDGDLISSNNLKTIFRVEPGTGDRTVVSSSAEGGVVGSGPAFDTLFDVILDANGDILASDTQIDTIFRVDPVTGDRTILTSNAVGSGPVLTFPGDLVLEADGNILTTEGGNDQVLRVDPVTGDRTIVSSSLSGSIVGSGIAIQNLGGIALELNGDIVVADAGQNAVIRIDPATGDRTEVSGPIMGSGPAFQDTFSIDVDSTGTIYVADGAVGVIQVDPTTGERVVISASPSGGLPIDEPRDVRVGALPAQNVPAASPLGLTLAGLLMVAGAALTRVRRSRRWTSASARDR